MITSLVAAIRAVYSDEVCLHPSVAKTLVNDYIQRIQMGWERASLHTRTELVRYAADKGLVDLGSKPVTE